VGFCRERTLLVSVAEVRAKEGSFFAWVILLNPSHRQPIIFEAYLYPNRNSLQKRGRGVYLQKRGGRVRIDVFHNQ